MYRRRISPSSGAARTGGEVRKSLSSWNALEASSFHSNLSDVQRSLKKGRPLSPSRLMNLLKIVILASPPGVYPVVEFQDGDLKTKSSMVT